jgi:hypothetical protein
MKGNNKEIKEEVNKLPKAQKSLKLLYVRYHMYFFLF